MLLKLENPDSTTTTGKAFVLNLDALYHFLREGRGKVDAARALAKEVVEEHNKTQGDVTDGALRKTIEAADVEDIRGSDALRGKFLLVASQVKFYKCLTEYNYL